MAFVAAVVLFAQLLFAVDPVVIGPPAPQPTGGQSTTVTNVTNVYPPPDKAVVVETEKEAAPTILQSGLQSVDKDGGATLSQVFQLALSIAGIRKDLIMSDAVREINGNMVRLVAASIGLVIAALCLWGLIGQLFGSDIHEAFECLGRLPLWVILAATSSGWLSNVMDAFAAIAGVVASSAHGAFGPTMREDFWSNAGLGVFALLVGLFYLINLFMFALQVFADTAFLGFCVLSAPVFLFLKTTPWTEHWGNNWLRMLPGTALDLLAMLAIMVVGAAGLDHLKLDNALLTIGFDLGLILCLPLIRRLVGLEHQSYAGRMFSAFFWYRMLRNHSGSNKAANARAGQNGAASASPTQPTRAPRWSHAYGRAASGKAGGYAGVLT